MAPCYITKRVCHKVKNGSNDIPTYFSTNLEISKESIIIYIVEITGKVSNDVEY